MADTRLQAVATAEVSPRIHFAGVCRDTKQPASLAQIDKNECGITADTLAYNGFSMMLKNRQRGENIVSRFYGFSSDFILCSALCRAVPVARLGVPRMRLSRQTARSFIGRRLRPMLQG